MSIVVHKRHIGSDRSRMGGLSDGITRRAIGRVGFLIFAGVSQLRLR